MRGRPETVEIMPNGHSVLKLHGKMYVIAPTPEFPPHQPPCNTTHATSQCVAGMEEQPYVWASQIRRDQAGRTLPLGLA
jgi:hypothetical protein